MRSKKNIRRIWLRKMFKIHALLLAVSFGLYFVLALLDPGLFSYDLRQKYRALADETLIVTASVLGPPEQPIVTGDSQCDEDTGTLTVELDWADDENTYTYDITRDSLPLVSGISTSNYSDTNVSLNTHYEYVVTANGPMGPGSASSDPVIITTLAECEMVAASPSVIITSAAGKDVAYEDGRVTIKTKRPLFTGTTNIPNATIQILVESDPVYSATTTANSNGYWEWKQPSNLEIGKHTITVTTIDPNDPNRRSTDVLYFKIVSKETKEEDFTDTRTFSEKLQEFLEKMPFFDYSLQVKNKDQMVLQGDILTAVLQIKDISSSHSNSPVTLRYSILDDKRDVIFSTSKEVVVAPGGVIEESLSMPLYMRPGKYFLVTEFFYNEVTISKETTFIVVALPLFRLSTGEPFTYSDLIKNLGQITFISLVIIFLWLFLFLRELSFYFHYHKHITEKHLKKAGFFHK